MFQEHNNRQLSQGLRNPYSAHPTIQKPNHAHCPRWGWGSSEKGSGDHCQNRLRVYPPVCPSRLLDPNCTTLTRDRPEVNVESSFRIRPELQNYFDLCHPSSLREHFRQIFKPEPQTFARATFYPYDVIPAEHPRRTDHNTS